jgi:RimJ/RimL family protein N-acetyltransferase
LAIGVDVPISKSGQRRWFNELDQLNSKMVFAICLREGNNHVGNVSLDLIHHRHRSARLSIFVADPAMRGQGIGSRAMRLLIEYAFEFLNLHRLYLRTTAGNPAVLNFYQKLGFKVEGQLRKHEFIRGRYVDKIVMGLIREDLADDL